MVLPWQSYSVTCYLTSERAPPNPSLLADTWCTNSGGLEGWVDLGYLVMQQLGVELVTSWWQVQSLNHCTIKPPCSRIIYLILNCTSCTNTHREKNNRNKNIVSAQEFVAQIGRRSTEVTTDPRETTFLFQRFSVAIQRFNAACVADTFPISESAPWPFQTRSILFFIFQPSGTEYLRH